MNEKYKYFGVQFSIPHQLNKYRLHKENIETGEIWTFMDHNIENQGKDKQSLITYFGKNRILELSMEEVVLLDVKDGVFVYQK